MYNVPFHLTHYNPQQQQQQQRQQQRQDNGDDRKTFPSPLTVSSMDSPPLPTDTLINIQGPDRSYQKITSTTFMPWSTGSPTPTNSTNSIPSKQINNTNMDQMDNNNNMNTSFKPPNPSPTTSSNIPKNDHPTTIYYSTNDQWGISHTTDNINTANLDNTLDQTSPIKSEDSDLSPNVDPLEQALQQQHMQQLFEKKRRRRESHNAVERRRRDNINERIYELSTLLPEPDATKNNKGTILRKSVEHIRMLHDEVNKCHHQIQELENLLAMYRMRVGETSLDISPNPPHHQQPHPHPNQSQQLSPRVHHHQQQQSSHNPNMMPPSAHSMNFPEGLQPHMAYYSRRNG